MSCKHGYIGNTKMLNLFRNISWLSFTQSLMNVCILIWRVVIGASLSEPHTSESNGGFISAVRTSFRKCRLTLLTRNIAHADPCGRNIQNNAVLSSAYTPTDRVKLPNQRGSKKTSDGAERDRTRRAAGTVDQRSERLRD